MAKRTLGLALLLTSGAALAQTTPLSDNFSGTSNALNWTSLYGACLTAGTATSAPSSGQIQSCAYVNSIYNSTTFPYQHSAGGASGSLPDASGSGALRLTSSRYNGSGINNQRGAIISNFVFPSSQGITVTFRTIAYGGDSGGSSGDGADGMSFFLTDASQTNNGQQISSSSPAVPTMGANGGSLGYSCTNDSGNAQAALSADGVYGAYVGIGIDEYGNFLNSGDNTATGSSVGAQGMRIGLRGGGNVNWKWLTTNYPNSYKSAWGATSYCAYMAVLNTCQTGMVWDFNYSNKACTASSTPRGSGTDSSNTSVLDYAYVPGAYSVLPSTKPMAAESATTRGAAYPIDYQLSITPNGLLSLSYSYNYGAYVTVINGYSITTANGGALPANFGFGFAGSTGGSTNIHEILCFKTAPNSQAAGSASVNAQQSGQIQVNSTAYLSFYHPVGWWGQVTANPILYNSTTNTVSIQSTPTWDASCVLTGGACASTGATGMTAQGSSSRTILTWSGTAGVAFNTNINSSTVAGEYNALGGASGYSGWSPTEAIELDYLRGGRSNEASSASSGTLRVRNGVLGDVIHSSPTWVGPPGLSYGSGFADNLYGTTGSESSYATYKTNQATRINVVYAGANDGMLHGFRAGALNADGSVNSSVANDGHELIAFVPAYVAGSGTPQTSSSATPSCPSAPDSSGNVTCLDNTNPLLNYTNVQYAHNWYVDGQIATGDLYYGSAWHTWLVSSLGRGGPDVFALDITNPSQFSESNASSIVRGEWGTSLSCSGNTTCGNNMGQITGLPLIRRLHDGNWALIFGNGINSSSGKAGIFILEISSTGTLATAYYLDTGTGSSSTPNGIVSVTSADLDGDHITDYLYAGDLLGNLWRFDLTSKTASSWAVTNYGSNSTVQPLFNTSSGHNASVQPISTAPSVVGVAGDAGVTRLIISFGTGQEFSFTDAVGTSYASGTQSLYGIWDWKMGAWNTLAASATTPNSVMSSATAPTAASPAATLVQQTLTTTSTSGTGVRSLTTVAMCWYGSVSCTSSATNYGWEVDLPGTGENVIYDPAILLGTFVVNTTIPPSVSVYSCTPAVPSGWTLAINVANGGAVNSSQNFFAGFTTSGMLLNAVGKFTLISAGTGSQQNVYGVSQNVQGSGVVQQLNPAGKGQRINWLQLR